MFFPLSGQVYEIHAGHGSRSGTEHYPRPAFHLCARYGRQRSGIGDRHRTVCKFYYPDVEALDYFNYENDRSLSDYDSILLLEDFDTNKIDNFLISVLKKYKLNAKLYIICKNENICSEVENYLKFNTGLSRIQEIYNRYVNGTYPGYWYTVSDKAIAVFDLYQ